MVFTSTFEIIQVRPLLRSRYFSPYKPENVRTFEHNWIAIKPQITPRDQHRKRASRSTSTQFFGRSGEQGDVLRTKTTSKYISTSMTIGAAAAAPLPRIDWPGEDK
ncbi:hypothetical protein OUZ56_013865 [Daphnia magna]|uniref:Uncharacterized protein n=1 Tax=Daphnia magna TaxID=35525 RepID=A0ABQ9Z764_9CRUS|nr:hypothetical protein OUZ56_013865 [Daphnia magna]